MRLKITTTAPEHNNPAGSQVFVQELAHNLLDYKMHGLSKGLIIPDDLIAELEEYAKRNSLGKIASDFDNPVHINECCPRCLKAHMLKTAEKIGISPEGRQFLSLFMPGEVGHSGYYLDEEELVEI